MSATFYQTDPSAGKTMSRVKITNEFYAPPLANLTTPPEDPLNGALGWYSGTLYYWDGTAWVPSSSGAAPVNIYNADGTLTANRLLNGNGHSLNFNMSTGSKNTFYSFSPDALAAIVSDGSTSMQVGISKDKVEFVQNGASRPWTIAANGNVGVGTLTPQQQFVVSKNGNEGIEFRLGDNSIFPGLTQAELRSANRGSGFSDIPMAYKASGHVFYTNGAGLTTLILTPTGLTGVNGMPDGTATFQVFGTAKMQALSIENTSSNGFLTVYGNTGATLELGNAATSSRYGRLSGDTSGVALDTATGLPIKFSPAGTETMRLLPNGNMGLGTNNPIPYNPGARGLIVSGASTSQIALLELWGDSSGKSIFQSAGGNTYIGNLVKGLSSGVLIFLYGDGQESFRVIGNGSIGVGTTNPTAKLSVNGSINCSDDTLDNTLSFLPNYNANGPAIQSTNVANSAVKPLFIQPAGGNTGLGGVPSPSATLHVGGDVKASAFKVQNVSGAATAGNVTIGTGVETATVNTTAVTANSIILLSIQAYSDNSVVSLFVSTRVAGTSFDVYCGKPSSSTVTVGWIIVEPS